MGAFKSQFNPHVHPPPPPSCLLTPGSSPSIIPDPNIHIIPKIKVWQDPQTTLSLFPQSSAQVLPLWVPARVCECVWVSKLSWNEPSPTASLQVPTTDLQRFGKWASFPLLFQLSPTYAAALTLFTDVFRKRGTRHDKSDSLCKHTV